MTTRPKTSSPGKRWRTNASLTIATGGAPSLSPSVNRRPRTRRIPTLLKYAALTRFDPRIVPVRWAIRSDDGQPQIATAEQTEPRQSNRTDAGDASQPLGECAIKSDTLLSLFRRCAARRGRLAVHFEHHDVVRLEARIDGIERGDSPQEQTGERDQQHRERELRDDQLARQTLSTTDRYVQRR